MADRTIKQLEADLEYHHKALNICPPDFMYRPDIESSKTENIAQIGHFYYRNNNVIEAIRAYKRTRSTDPDHFQSLYQLGKCYRQLQQFTEARFYYDEIIERATESRDFYHKIDAYLGKGWSHLEEGEEINLTKAEKYLELVYKLAPNYSELQSFKNQLAKQQAEHEAQIAGLLQKAQQQLINKNWREADTTLKALKRLSPNHEAAQQLRETLRNTISTKAFMDFTNTLFNGNQPTLVANILTKDVVPMV